MLKSALIALAALVVVDAAAQDGQYRHQLIRGCNQLASEVFNQDWTSGPLA